MKRLVLGAVPALALLAGCQTVDELPTQRLGQATLRLGNGLPAGTVQLLGAGNQVNLVIAAAGLAEGSKGTHLHMVGKCDAPDFASAGGHLNPAGHQHGSANPAGSHLGDLPNIVIGSAGAGTLSATLPGTRDEALAAIFDADGTAVMIHAGPDDYKTDPSGNSGSRVACGVLTRG